MSGQQSNLNHIRTPQFIVAGVPAVQQRGTTASLNLDDIFGDCFFTPEGEAIFLSENPQLQQQLVQQQQLLQAEQQKLSFLASGEANVAQNASRPNTTGGGFALVAPGGGIVTTGLHEPMASATVMGTGVPPPAAPFAQAPQRPHHLQYAFIQASATQAHMLGGSASLTAVGDANPARGAAVAAAVGINQESKQDRR